MATWYADKDEATAARRTLTFQLMSNITAPLTTAPTSSASSIRMSVNGAAMITPAVAISAVSAPAGIYGVVLNQSDVSVLGNHVLWWQGQWVQELGTLMVGNNNQYSNLSNIAAKAYSGVTVEVNNAGGDVSSRWTVAVAQIKAGAYSGVTVGAGDYAAKDMGSSLTVGVGNIKAADYSSIVTVGVGIATPSKVSVQVSANNDKTGYTVSTVQDKTGYTVSTVQDKAGYTITAGDYSSTVTFGAGTIKSGTYSGVTVGINNIAAADYTSKVSVGVGLLAASAIPAGAFQANSIDNVAVKPGLYSGVSVDVRNIGNVGIAAGSYSGVTIQGLSSIQSADIQMLSGSAAWLTLLTSHLSSVVTGQVVSGVSATQFTADLSAKTADNYNGRVIVFTSLGLYGQATSINSVGGFIGFSNTSSRFNVAALTGTPPAASQFIIV